MALSHPSWTVDTTFSGKDISTAASVYTLTAAVDAKVQFTVKLTNAAGNGDYVIYLKRQWLGAGTASVVLPKATCPAASGETVIEFVSLELSVKATDVVDVYIDGLAGDTSVNGAIRISADNPSVFDQANDVPAANVTTWKGATAPDMTGDAYARLGAPAGASVSADVAAVKVDTAAVLEDTGTTLDTLIKDIPTVAEFEARTLAAADYTVVSDLPAAAPSAADVADAVWDEAIAGHADAGSTGAALAGATAPAAADVADAVWDELLADHTDAGSAGAGLAAAGSAGDPWSTVLPGSYGASTAGQIIGELLSDLSDAHGDGSWEGSSAGSGTGSYTDTITDDDSNPLDGVRVQLYTGASRAGLAYEAYTNALGVFEMWPDPGVYYRWLDLSGYSFSQDVAVTVTEP